MKNTIFFTSIVLLLTACAQSGTNQGSDQGSGYGNNRSGNRNNGSGRDFNQDYRNAPNCYNDPNCNSNTQNRNYTNTNAGYAEQTQNEDWTITWKVKQVLLSESNLAWSSRFIHVVTSDGVVTLTGSVASQDDMDLIVRRVKNVTGVKKVNNQMTVSGS